MIDIKEAAEKLNKDFIEPYKDEVSELRAERDFLLAQRGWVIDKLIRMPVGNKKVERVRREILDRLEASL